MAMGLHEPRLLQFPDGGVHVISGFGVSIVALEIGSTHYMQPPLGVRVRPRRLAHLRTPLPDTSQPALGSRLTTTLRPQMIKVSKSWRL